MSPSLHQLRAVALVAKWASLEHGPDGSAAGDAGRPLLARGEGNLAAQAVAFRLDANPIDAALRSPQPKQPG